MSIARFIFRLAHVLWLITFWTMMATIGFLAFFASAVGGGSKRS